MPAIDPYGAPSRLDAPAYRAVAVTPNDNTDLTTVCRALYIGAAGNVVVNMAGDGSTVTFIGVPTGSVLPIAVSRVKATSTTAGSIVALY